MNRKNKILVFFLVIFISLSNIFAFDANIQIDKNETDINDYIKLRVIINSDEGGEIGVTQIKGLDNFEIINQSQSQSSSTSIVIVDGKNERKTETSHNLDLVLKAKQKGEYLLGPAYLQKGEEEVKTNNIKIKVTGDNLFVNNNHLQLPKQNNNQLKATESKPDILNELDDKIEDYEDIEKKVFSNDDNILYILFGILLLMSVGFYFIVKNNSKGLEKGNQNNIKKDEYENKINDNESISFESLEAEINYPSIDSSNFISVINKIFKQKIGSKYKIENVNNKTSEELFELIPKGENEIVNNIINMLNEAKYSNLDGDNNKLLEMIKNI